MNNLDIKNLRVSLKLKQQEFADLVGVSKSAVQKWESGERFPEEIQIQKLTEIADGLTKAHGINTEAFRLEEFENNNSNYFSALPNGQYVMTMPLAEINIQAGFLDHYQDIEYVRELAQHSIIVDQSARGKYVAFRVKGDSMDDGTVNAIPANYIVSTRELQQHHWRNKLHYKTFPYWVIYTTENSYPLLKEIIDHDVEKGVITCHSLNPSREYGDFELSLNEVRALFYVIDISRPVANRNYY